MMRSPEKISRFVLPLGLVFFLLLGLGIRLYDLTDLPFDYHPTRQWRGLIISRGIYYQGLDTEDPYRVIALEAMDREAVIEPLVMETLMAQFFKVFGLQATWGGRLLSSLFWVLGALAVYGFAREVGFPAAGLLAVAYYLFVPYAMVASRTVQPDPLMVALMAFAIWAAACWQRVRTPRAAVAAGLLAGLSIYVKTVSIFMLGGALAGLVLAPVLSEKDGPARLRSLVAALRDRQVWVLAGLSILPLALYYIYGLFIAGFLRQQLKFRFFPEMWRDPAFYIRWVETSTGIAGFVVVLAGFLGIFLLKDRALRGMGAGLWFGYLAYSMTFPYHTITHDYYQLPLIAIAAFSIVPLAGVLLDNFRRLENSRLVFAVLAALVLFGVLFKVWDTRVILARKDYRPEAGEWDRFVDIIPPDRSVLAITQTYGFPLSFFGWVNATRWPTQADTELRLIAGIESETLLDNRFDLLDEHDLFLVTNFNEFERQSDIRELLYGTYEIYDEGQGYILFDLKTKK